MNTKACIFDLDGVIVDTTRYHFMAWQRLAGQLKIRFTQNDNERLKGVSRIDSLDIILEIGGLEMDIEQKEKLTALKNKWYIDYIKKMTPREVLPGSIEFILELKEAGIKVALGSASKNTHLILERVGLDEFFDAIADGNNVSKAKPDPEVFITAAKLVKIKPESCIVFEDAVAGVRAALNAGMICVGVGSEKVLTEAHVVVSGLNKMNLKKLQEIEKLSGYE